MIKLIIFLLLLGWSVEGRSQNWDEWFKQKKTQKKYLMEQIAAFQAYLAFAREGYKIASEGLIGINAIKNGEYRLHNLFFSGLKTVNSAVKNNKNAQHIQSLYSSVRALYDRFEENIRNLSLFEGEIKYAKNIMNRARSDCANLFHWYRILITDGSVEMNDKERLERLATISAELKQRYTFVKHFSTEIKVLAASRIHEKNEIKGLRTLNNIK